MKDLLNIFEYDGEWHKLGGDGNCEKFIMSDLKELLMKERKETLEYGKDRIKKIIKDMPDTFPELERDDYDQAYQDAKQYILDKLK